MSSSSSLAELASEDLIVFIAESEGYYNAISSRAFVGNLPDAAKSFPHAVFQAQSVRGVQQAVHYCRENKLKLCVRSGGHSWETTWLQGSESVLLDVGDLKHIKVDATTASVKTGPGAASNEVLQAVLPHNLFFPCGHCQGVPVGGFLLGGGWGIGYSKYGLSCHFIQEMDVVLADGSLITAKADSDDPKQQMLLQLAKGSYAAFPGVITQYKLGPLLPKPTIVRGTVFYRLENWKKALELGQATCKVPSMENTIIFTYAPTDMAEAGKMVAMVALDIYDDNGVELWKEYTSTIRSDDLLVPLEEPQVCSPEEVPSSLSYPTKARFQTQVFFGDNTIFNSQQDLHTHLQPVVDLWLLESSNKPPPPSHTLVVCNPPGREKLVTGLAPRLGVQTYAIYADATQDEAIQQQLVSSHSELAKNKHCYTSLVEGNTRRFGAKSGFTDQAFRQVQEWRNELDPNGVFAGFPINEIV